MRKWGNGLAMPAAREVASIDRRMFLLGPVVRRHAFRLHTYIYVLYTTKHVKKMRGSTCRVHVVLGNTCA